MKNFINQVRICSQSELYQLSLFASLSIPDICGALASNDGLAKGHRYIKWFDKYVGYKYEGFLTGKDCYKFRCSLLHQGSTFHKDSSYKRIIFVEPNNRIGYFHCNISEGALNLDIRTFTEDIIAGAEQWLIENEKTENYKKNNKKFIRRYPNGYPPHFVGVPVIT
jgi:hypothetical protein